MIKLDCLDPSALNIQTHTCSSFPKGYVVYLQVDSKEHNCPFVRWSKSGGLNAIVITPDAP